MTLFRGRGRLSPAQKRALEQDDDGLLWNWRETDFAALFTLGQRPLLLDIGSGDGSSAVATAQRRPDWDILAVDPYPPGVGGTLVKARSLGLTNLRVALADVRDLIDRLPRPCCQRIRLLFPDPWHKKRHHKRRLVAQSLVEQLSACLIEGGVLHLATDNADYAEQMQPLFSRDVWHIYPQRRELQLLRPETPYAQRAHRLGNRVFDLRYRKISSG